MDPDAPDMLLEQFKQQAEFMELLREKRGFPDWPVDLSSKPGQQACREALLGAVEEAFESLANLRNWKKHRASETKELDRAAFLEEMCDAVHYLWEVLLLAGVSAEEFHAVYMQKGRKNDQRIREGY